MRTLIKNARVITPFEIKSDASVLIEGGLISDLLPLGAVKESGFDQIIDAEGKYLAPGFIDLHNHGNFGHDAMEGTEQAIRSMADFQIKNGVTSFLLTTMTSRSQDIKKALQAAGEYLRGGASFPKVKAQVLGVYLEGPYFSREKKGAQPEEHLRTPDLEQLQEFIEISKDTIKVVSLAPELKGAIEMIKYLKARGITAAGGHSMATFDQAKLGIDAGITLATHLFNGMRDFSHREPGIVGAALSDERVYGEIICDLIHLHPAAVQLAWQVKGKERIVLITDAIMAAGLADGDYRLGGQAVHVEKGIARLKAGALAGSTLSLNEAVFNMVEKVNVPLQEAVRMASLNPAEVIGESHRKGSIEPGKDADLIIFDERLRIHQAWVQGKAREFSVK